MVLVWKCFVVAISSEDVTSFARESDLPTFLFCCPVRCVQHVIVWTFWCEQTHGPCSNAGDLSGHGAVFDSRKMLWRVVHV